jgi:hypothetical protein
MHKEEGFHICLDTINKKSPPLGSGLPLALECTKTGFITLMKVPKKTQQEFKTKPSEKII